MNKTTKWIIGIVVVLVILQFAAPFVMRLIYPAFGGYGMMGGYGSPMMRGGGMMNSFGGFGHMGFGFFGFFMWLFPLALLVLIVLGIVYLWKKVTEKPAQE